MVTPVKKWAKLIDDSTRSQTSIELNQSDCNTYTNNLVEIELSKECNNLVFRTGHKLRRVDLN
jgi:hypothetical protein